MGKGKVEIYWEDNEKKRHERRKGNIERRIERKR